LRIVVKNLKLEKPKNPRNWGHKKLEPQKFLKLENVNL
jgi:hypothetical protein